MRALTVSCLISVLAASFTISAASTFSAEAAPRKSLTGPVRLVVSVMGRYGEQRTEITKDENRWICVTEQNPYFPSSKIPYSSTTLAQILKLRAPSKGPADCRDKVTVTDFAGPDRTPRTGCANEAPFKALLNELSKNCGRAI